MSDELPQSAVTAAARELETALRTVSWDTWDDLARKVLAAALPALTAPAAAQAAADEALVVQAQDYVRDEVPQLIAEAVYEEREACAQLAERYGRNRAASIAALIRARGLLGGTADGAHTPGGIPSGVCPGCNNPPAPGQKWCQQCIDEANAEAQDGAHTPGGTT